jgi:hypothetical protein
MLTAAERAPCRHRLLNPAACWLLLQQIHIGLAPPYCCAPADHSTAPRCACVRTAAGRVRFAPPDQLHAHHTAAAARPWVCAQRRWLHAKLTEAGPLPPVTAAGPDGLAKPHQLHARRLQQLPVPWLCAHADGCMHGLLYEPSATCCCGWSGQIGPARPAASELRVRGTCAGQQAETCGPLSTANTPEF